MRKIDDVCIPLKTIERWADVLVRSYIHSLSGVSDPHQLEKVASLWAELDEIIVINQLANELEEKGEE